MEAWLQQLLIQVPFAGIVIYFMLKHGDQDAKERQERNREWAAEVKQRDEQWREFLKQRDEQWIAALAQTNEAYTLINAAIVKQLAATEEQLKMLTIETKATQIKLAQMEQCLVLSVDQLQSRRSSATRTKRTAE